MLGPSALLPVNEPGVAIFSKRGRQVDVCSESFFQAHVEWRLLLLPSSQLVKSKVMTRTTCQHPARVAGTINVVNIPRIVFPILRIAKYLPTTSDQRTWSSKDLKRLPFSFSCVQMGSLLLNEMVDRLGSLNFRSEIMQNELAG